MDTLPTEKVVGLKQVTKAVRSGRAEKVFLACDASERVKQPLRVLCETQGVPTDESATLIELGKAAGIAVGAAAAAILKAQETR